MIFPGKGNDKWVAANYILLEFFNIKNKKPKGWTGRQTCTYLQHQVSIRDKTWITWDPL